MESDFEKTISNLKPPEKASRCTNNIPLTFWSVATCEVSSTSAVGLFAAIRAFDGELVQFLFLAMGNVAELAVQNL